MKVLLKIHIQNALPEARVGKLYPLSVNKVLLEQSHHLSTYCLWLLS